MSGTVTIIPQISPDQFHQRLARLIPHGWAGDDAAQDGLVGEFLQSLSEQLEFVLGELQYAAAAQRLTSETFPELDTASTDFLGSSLPRPSGMDDADYGQLIIANLFKQADTRLAISNAIQLLTGVTPRMIEPWNIFDTGTWDHISYWDVDTPANPARWGDGSLSWQGFIETVPPAIPAIGANNPILTFDDGAFWDVPGYFFGTIQSQSTQVLYDLINKLRVYGTTVWVKILTQIPSGAIVAPNAPGSVTASATSAQTVVVSWATPTVGTAGMNFQVFYQQVGSQTVLLGPTSITNSVVVSGLTPGTSYVFNVQASNLGGRSPLSLSATATTSLVVPGPATGLVATAIGPNSVVISFLPPTSGTPPFNFQVLYRVTSVGGPFTAFGIAGPATTVTVTGLLSSTRYDFEVRTANI